MKDIIKKKYYHTIILLLAAGIILTGCRQDPEEKLQEIQLEEAKEIKEEPDAKTEPDSEETPKEPVQKIFVYVCGQFVHLEFMRRTARHECMRSLPWQAPDRRSSRGCSESGKGGSRWRADLHSNQRGSENADAWSRSADTRAGISRETESELKYCHKRRTDDPVRSGRVQGGKYPCIQGRKGQISKYRRTDADQRHQRRIV